MFIGEFLCCVPLLWQRRNKHQYAPVGEDEGEEEETLSGWRMGWMWFPAFFDSESTTDVAD
jgi:hypothetical protein